MTSITACTLKVANPLVFSTVFIVIPVVYFIISIPTIAIQLQSKPMSPSINPPPLRHRLLAMWAVPLLKHRQGEQHKRSMLHPSQVSDF